MHVHGVTVDSEAVGIGPVLEPYISDGLRASVTVEGLPET
jgi:hypothetical protein